MNISKSIIFAIIATVAPAAMHAAAVTSNPTLSVGGYNFSGFSCSLTSGGSAVDPSDCSQINVNTITTPGTGIEISSGFIAAEGPKSFDDAVIRYNVSASHGIDNIGLDFNGNFLGRAVSSVAESVYSGNTLVGYASVTCGSDVGCTRTSDVMLNGTYSNLSVEKDIYVASFGAHGIASISTVDQTFANAPEPSSLALLGSGLIGASVLLRRKAKKA